MHVHTVFFTAAREKQLQAPKRASQSAPGEANAIFGLWAEGEVQQKHTRCGAYSWCGALPSLFIMSRST